MLIRVVREAGGLGDLIRLFPMFKGLKEKFPGSELHFYNLSHYRGLVMPHHTAPGLDPYIDCFINCYMQERRPRMAPHDENKYSYLKRGVKYDLSLEAYCPAYVHEVVTKGAVFKERTHLWLEHVGLPFQRPVYHVRPEEEEWSEYWLKEIGAKEGEIIAIQPFGTTRARNWPPENWMALIEFLLGAGFFVVVLDCCGRPAGFKGHVEVNPSWGHLGAILKKASLVVGGDSGLFHLGNAVYTHSLGLFGQTNGDVMCKAYPKTGHWMTSPEWPKDAPACQFPCYGRWERGYNQVCRDKGCTYLNSLEPVDVFNRILEIFPNEKFQPKENWDITEKVGKDYFTQDYWTNATISGYRGYGPNWPIHYAIAEMTSTVFGMKKGDRILDYGGAFGYHASIIQEKVGVDSYLTDASKYAVENCHKNVKGKEQWADVGTEPLRWEDSFFDFILAIEVMEHIYFTDVEFALKELYRVMKPGCLMYSSIDLQERREPRFIDKTHQTMRPEGFWRDWYDKAGFVRREDLEKEFFNFVSTVKGYKGQKPVQSVKWNVFVYEKPLISQKDSFGNYAAVAAQTGE